MPYIPEFLVVPLSVALITAFSLSVVSVFVVLNRWGFLTVGVSHGAFGGVALGVLIGVSPFITGVLSGFLLVVLVYFLRRKMAATDESLIGLIYPVFMALGIMVFSVADTGYVSAFSYLFGSLLAAGEDYFIVSLSILFLTVLFVFFFRKAIFLWMIDEEMAKAFGVRTNLIYFSLIVITTLNIVLAMKTLGVIMVSAFAIMPAVFAVGISGSVLMLFCSSILYTVFCFLVGIFVSLYFNVPPGPVITIVGFVVLLLFRFGIRFKIRR